MASKKKAGRPVKPSGERKDNSIRFRVTDAQRAAIEAAAKAADRELSDFVRLAVLRQIGVK